MCHCLFVTNPVVGEQAARDDIHLILEYKAGDSWGPFTAPRANRYSRSLLLTKLFLLMVQSINNTVYEENSNSAFNPYPSIEVKRIFNKPICCAVVSCYLLTLLTRDANMSAQQTFAPSANDKNIEIGILYITIWIKA